MFKLIVQKELRELLLSTKFAITFAVCSILIILSFYTGARSYHAERSRTEAATSESRRQMEGQTDWLAVTPMVVMPAQPLAHIVTGVANDIGRTTEVMGRGELHASGSRYGEDPVLALFRFIDLEFTFQVVLSLFAILFAYDAICGERERGTLRLALSNAVPRGTFILGKIAGAFIGLTAPLLIPLSIGGLLLIAMQVPMTGSDWIRLGLVIIAGILFVGAFLGLSVLVSTLTRNSATSFVALLSLWVITILIIPRASVLLAARQVDVPTSDSIISQKSRLRGQRWGEDQKTISDFLRNAEREDGAGGPMGGLAGKFNEMFERLGKERDEAVAGLGAKLREERNNRERQQQRLAFGLARLSPASAYSLAVTGLAGTSLDLPDRYSDSLREYQQRFADFQKEKTGSTGGGIRIILKTDGDEEEEPAAIDTREMPVFAFSPPSVDQALHDSIFDLTLLALFNLLFFSGAYAAFLRYDVR